MVQVHAHTCNKQQIMADRLAAILEELSKTDKLERAVNLLGSVAGRRTADFEANSSTLKSGGQRE